MGLRALAARHTKWIATNTNHFANGSVVVTNPAGASSPFAGLTNNIAEVIDTDTGMTLSGRSASVAIPISDLVDSLGFPEAVAETTRKPWVVVYEDTEGNSYTFKVVEVLPDRTVDLVTCILEDYTQ
jgi:hypothetical protein